MTFKDKLIADNVAVAAAGTQYSSELDLENGEFQGTLAYHITTASGTPEVAVEFSYGVDANGARVWHTERTSTAQTDRFETAGLRPERARLRITETGGTNGLSGVMARAKLSDE